MGQRQLGVATGCTLLALLFIVGCVFAAVNTAQGADSGSHPKSPRPVAPPSGKLQRKTAGLAATSARSSRADALVGGKGNSKRRRGAWVQNSVSAMSSGEGVLMKKKKTMGAPPGVDKWYDACYVVRPYRSTNYQGWRTCAAGHYQAGYFRSGCDNLSCLSGWKCCRPKNEISRGWSDCYHENVWTAMDRKGWHGCGRPGYYMTGWYKTAGNKLFNIESFNCCRPQWSEKLDGTCYQENWYKSLDKNWNWNTCSRPNTFVKKIYRNSCHELHCLEHAQCCSPAYPRPATLAGVRATGKPVITYGSASILRGREKLYDTVMDDERGQRKTRVKKGHVEFKRFFARPPVVHASLGKVALKRRVSLKLDIFVEKVTQKGFDFVAQTWGDSVIDDATIEWMAVGQDSRAYGKRKLLWRKIYKLSRENRKLKDKMASQIQNIGIARRESRKRFYAYLQKFDYLIKKFRQLAGLAAQFRARARVFTENIRRGLAQVEVVRREVQAGIDSVKPPEDVQAIWDFAKSLKKWGSKTLLFQRRTAMNSLAKVRQDMSAIWHASNKESDDLDLEILTLEDDLQSIKALRKKWLIKHGCKNCGELHVPDFENLEEKIKAIKKKEGIHGTLASVGNMEKYGLPPGFWGSNRVNNKEPTAMTPQGVPLKCKCDKTREGPKKCVCVQGRGSQAAKAPALAGGEHPPTGLVSGATSDRPLVLSLLFEEGTAIPPSIHVIGDDEELVPAYH